jgi:hypothetical protein
MNAPAGRYGAGIELWIEHLQDSLDMPHIVGEPVGFLPLILIRPSMSAAEPGSQRLDGPSLL